MTDVRRRLSGVHVRYLAVAVLLAGMAYVTYDTQKQVHQANDDRADLRKKVTQLDTTVKALTAENKRLTRLLLNAGIDPSAAPAPVPAPSASRARTVVVRPSAAPRRATNQVPRSTPAASPTPRVSRTPSPQPTPSSTCLIRSPLDGRCLT